MSEITTESAAVLIVGAGSTGLSSGECPYAVGRSCADHQAEAAAFAAYLGDELDAAHAGTDLYPEVP